MKIITKIFRLVLVVLALIYCWDGLGRFKISVCIFTLYLLADLFIEIVPLSTLKKFLRKNHVAIILWTIVLGLMVPFFFFPEVLGWWSAVLLVFSMLFLSPAINSLKGENN